MRLCTAVLACAVLLPAQIPQATLPHAPAAKAPTVDPNTIVMTFGDRQITAAGFELLVKTLVPAAQQSIALGAGRRQAAEQFAAVFALAEEALRQKIDERPELAFRLRYQRQSVLENAIFKILVQSAVVSDADVQAWYDSHLADYATVTARHILIHVKGAPTPGQAAGKSELSDAEARAKAESIRNRLIAGEDFTKIAKEESDDAPTAIKGGDLGEFKHGMLVAPFEQAAFALKAGEISQPVRTPYGYHIIQVQSRSTRSLADVRPEILAQLKPAAARTAAEALVDQAKYTIDDAFFGPAPVPLAIAPK